ncbi:hypothetical protein KY330_01630 [Candidatus Woesearchaeota archaeon]|nr:hypothetical protein [Candidatus Woesearchaeota archaeon]
MKCIFFDAGPMISLALNNLLWVVGKLKKKYRGEFCITEGVRYELIERPLHIKKFEFESLQILRQLRKKNLKLIMDKRIEQKANELLELANSIFYSGNHPIKIVQRGEMESLAAAIVFDADALVIDERTARVLLEEPDFLAKLLTMRLHRKIRVDRVALKRFSSEVKYLKIIRSIELVTIAFELGLLDEYLPDMPNARRILLDAVLWGVKLNGCAVTRKEIDDILRLESSKSS